MAAIDNFKGAVPAAKMQPFTKGEVVSKSDTVDLVNVSRAIWVGGAGNLVVTMADGGDVTFTAVAAGTLLNIRVSRVKAATSATNMVALS